MVVVVMVVVVMVVVVMVVVVKFLISNTRTLVLETNFKNSRILISFYLYLDKNIKPKNNTK
jgi:hypothetical protein